MREALLHMFDLLLSSSANPPQSSVEPSVLYCEVATVK